MCASGATSGAGLLAVYGYDSLGRRESLTHGNGTSVSYGYDGVSRLQSMTHELAGTAHDLTLGFQYNNAGQIVEVTRSNDAYATSGLANSSRTDTHDGRNRIDSGGGTQFTHDARGNIATDGTNSYTHRSDNRLIASDTGGTAATYDYDPLNRLSSINAAHSTGLASRIDHDGDHIIRERHPVLPATAWRAYAYGADGTPLLSYFYYGKNLDQVSRYWHQNDERGSVVAQPAQGWPRRPSMASLTSAIGAMPSTRRTRPSAS